MDKIIDNLYIGDVFEAINLFQNPGKFVACASVGVEFIVSEIYAERFSAKKPINHIIVPLLDSTDNSICQFIAETNQFIDNNIVNGNVLVHCHAGISRSPSIVFAYLLYKNYSPEKAWKTIKESRKQADPHRAFLKEILHFYNYKVKE